MKAHAVTFRWSKEYLDVDIACPFAADDPERPCRMYADFDTSDNPTELMDGCGVKDALEAGGIEAVGLDDDIVSAPVPVQSSWDPDGFWCIAPISAEKL